MAYSEILLQKPLPIGTIIFRSVFCFECGEMNEITSFFLRDNFFSSKIAQNGT
jgi:hypothetical protein